MKITIITKQYDYKGRHNGNIKTVAYIKDDNTITSDIFDYLDVFKITNN